MYEIIENYEAWRCPAWSTHFQIIDLLSLRRLKIFHSYIDTVRPYMFSVGWSEDVIRSLFLRTDLRWPDIYYYPSQKILCMQRWVPGYTHKGVSVAPKCDTRWP